MQDEDENIVSGLLKAESWAQERLVREFGPGLYTLLNSWTRDREYAEDLLSETFVRALNKLRGYDPARGSLWSWLASMARRIYLDWVGRNGGVYVALECAESEQVLHEGWGAGCGTEQERAFHEALNGLTAQEKDVLAICYLSGRSTEEIARWVGITVGALWQRKCRALRRLKRRMKGMEVFRELFAGGSPEDEGEVIRTQPPRSDLKEIGLEKEEKLAWEVTG
jgi:RNA polymerase sigma-70 factor (ECF subfamily)